MFKSFTNLLCLLFFAVFIFSCKTVEKNTDIFSMKAPEIFKAEFETTKGKIEITAERNLSPLAVDRFYQLIVSGYFTNLPFYRGVPNFVIQFGTLDTVLDKKWSDHIILDEPVRKSNDIGTLSFARAGKNTRGTQLFINLKNNARLDTVSYGETLGFPAFGWVSGGMDVVKKICVDYNDEPRKKLDSIKEDVDSFLKKNFPDLDYIKKAVILK